MSGRCGSYSCGSIRKRRDLFKDVEIKAIWDNLAARLPWTRSVNARITTIGWKSLFAGNHETRSTITEHAAAVLGYVEGIRRKTVRVITSMSSGRQHNVDMTASPAVLFHMPLDGRIIVSCGEHDPSVIGQLLMVYDSC
jgi:hypothetical protein